MKTLPPPTLNRRQWLHATGAAVAGLTLAPRLRSTPAAAKIDYLPVTPAGLVQLSLNENTLGASPRAIAAMRAHLEQTCRYPYGLTPSLVKTIAAKEGVTPDHIVMGVGSGELLEGCAALFSREPGEVVTAVPGYLQMVAAMERRGCTVVGVPVNDRLEHDLDAMAAKVGPATRCVYICNPNNPTGTLVAADRLRAFAVAAARQAPVFIDEAYLECADDFAGNTLVGLVAAGHNVIVARTFSKIHGLAGQRIGYAVMAPATARAVRAHLTGSMNLMGVVAAQASLADPDFVAGARARIKAGRDALLAVLRERGCRYAEPQGSFVFFQTGQPIAEFQARMRARGVIVARPFPPLLDWCRISVGTPAEMAVAHAALRAVL